MKTQLIRSLIRRAALLLFLSTLNSQFSTTLAQGTAFTYQGRLDSNGAPFTGSAEFQPTLWNAANSGTQIATNNPATVNVGVTNGLFVLPLDFGNQFPGANRWLQLDVRASTEAFSLLSPRQKLTATPYAITASNLTGNLPAAQLSGALPSANLAGTYSGVVTFNSAANSFNGTFTGNGSGLTSLNANNLNVGTVPEARLAGNVARTNQVWLLAGNAGTTPGAQFLGTTDNQALELRVNNLRALRLEPDTNSPNVIGGSSGNLVGAGYHGSVIGGGGTLSGSNTIFAHYAAIAGGLRNAIGTNSGFAAIGGGVDNTIAANSTWSTIAGGALNAIGADSFRSTIGGGSNNNIEDDSSYATIAGGFANAISTNSDLSAIGGGANNQIAASSVGGTIAGGQGNGIGTNSPDSAIGGGLNNKIAANASAATIAGGYRNDIGANSSGGAIGGGTNNNILANVPYATIAGGRDNDIGTNSGYSAIGGGFNNNIATGSSSATIAGGFDNNIGANSDYSSIGGGLNNNIAGNALYATIPGGRLNVATNYAFAAGSRAKANHTGAFVWGDSTATDLASAAEDTVTMRASGGYRLFSNAGATAGVSLAAGGGSWTSISDRNAKENLAPVNARSILEKVAALSLSTWNYKSQAPAIRHIGPMAQDFKATFAVGESDTGITGVDADGVALAAIQGLNEKVEVRTEKAELRIQKLEAENAELKRRLEAVEEIIRNRKSE